MIVLMDAIASTRPLVVNTNSNQKPVVKACKFAKNPELLGERVTLRSLTVSVPVSCISHFFGSVFGL